MKETTQTQGTYSTKELKHKRVQCVALMKVTQMEQSNELWSTLVLDTPTAAATKTCQNFKSKCWIQKLALYLVEGQEVSTASP